MQIHIGKKMTVALIVGAYAGKRIVQARGGSLLVQCIVGFGPGLIPAAVCWRQLR